MKGFFGTTMWIFSKIRTIRGWWEELEEGIGGISDNGRRLGWGW